MRRLAFAISASLALLMLLAPQAAGLTIHFPDSQRGVFSLGVLGGGAFAAGQLADDVTLDTDAANSGLRLRPGWSGGPVFDYYLGNRWALGLWGMYNSMPMHTLVVVGPTSQTRITNPVHAQTDFVGGYVKWFATAHGPWTPSVFAGLTAFHREIEVADEAANVFPAIAAGDLTDTKLGFSGGAGLEYAITERMGLSVLGSVHSTGHFTRAIAWSDTRSTTLKNWNLMLVGAGIQYHFGLD